MKMTLAKDVKTTKQGQVVYWTVRWYDSQGRRRSKSIGKVDDSSPRAERKSRKEAERAVVLLEKEYSDTPSKANRSKAPTLRQYADIYLEHKRHEFEPKTIAMVERAIVYLVRHFGEGCTIDKISVFDALNFKSSLADGKLKDENDGEIKKNDTEGTNKRKGGKARELSLTSVNIYMRMIKAMFGYAVEAELIQENPFKKTVATVRTGKDWHYITKEELGKILDAALPQVGIIIALCRLAGLRRGEAIALQWDNIDWEHGAIIIAETDDWKPKDKERRIVPMCKELSDILLKAHEEAPEGQVKVSTASVLNLNQNVLRAVKRAGLLPYKKPLHTLRKNCLTDWAATMPLHTVKEWAGHADIATTEKHYLKVSENDFNSVSHKSFWTENGRKIEKETEKAPAAEQEL